MGQRLRLPVVKVSNPLGESYDHENFGDQHPKGVDIAFFRVQNNGLIFLVSSHKFFLIRRIHDLWCSPPTRPGAFYLCKVGPDYVECQTVVAQHGGSVLADEYICLENNVDYGMAFTINEDAQHVCLREQLEG
jgi:hypothetical protein